jgi:hypothetical protein
MQARVWRPRRSTAGHRRTQTSREIAGVLGASLLNASVVADRTQAAVNAMRLEIVHPTA